MDRKRDELIVKVDVDREVTWDEVNRKSRIPKGDASTDAKRMKEAFGIKRRTPPLQTGTASKTSTGVAFRN